MKKIYLSKDTPIYCLIPSEAIVLDDHIEGYFNHGINLNNNDVVVDVGANIGVLGMRLSTQFENIHIHSFEPIPAIFDVLQKNSELSKNPYFKVYQNGIGEKNEEKEFTFYPNSPALSTANPEIWKQEPNTLINAVKGSIQNAPKKFWWAKFIPSFFAPIFTKYLTSSQQKSICKIITISHFIETEKIDKIDLLKIDCEGLEWQALKGIKDTDWGKIKSCVIEVHDIEGRLNKVTELLSLFGFKITLEKEESLKETKLTNVYATK